MNALARSVASIAIALCASNAFCADEQPRHHLPVSPDGNLVIGLCDGETSLAVPGVRPGDPMTREQGQEVASALMEEWSRKHPGAKWEQGVAVADAGPAAQAAAPTAPSGPKVQAQTYGNFTERDEAIWKASTQQLIDEGKRIFHDAKALGGTVAISCDMCHPDGSNTHPETYPKYQVQIGRVALLRDMINWCIENPVRGKPLPDDDPRLKALEAYIIAQRKGFALDFGKH